MAVLLVQITVISGRQHEAQAFIQKMQEHTRREPGCRMYLGHRSTENSRHFILYAQYDDKALDAHRAVFPRLHHQRPEETNRERHAGAFPTDRIASRALGIDL